MTYPSDLNDAEWQQIQPLLPSPKSVGKQRQVDLRAVLDAIFYRADNGIKWRALPIDFPNWQTVYGYYRAESGRGKLLPAHFLLWVRLDLWQQINDALVEQVRLEAERQAQPSLGICDSQSVKLGKKGGHWRSALTATSKSKGESGMS